MKVETIIQIIVNIVILISLLSKFPEKADKKIRCGNYIALSYIQVFALPLA